MFFAIVPSAQVPNQLSTIFQWVSNESKVFSKSVEMIFIDDDRWEIWNVNEIIYSRIYTFRGLRRQRRNSELTRKPDVLSRRHRKRTVKLRSRRWLCWGERASCKGRLAFSAGRKEFHMSCLWSSSRSSLWTSSYTLWWTMSDWNRKKRKRVIINKRATFEELLESKLFSKLIPREYVWRSDRYLKMWANV